MSNGTNWASMKNAYYKQWRQNRKQQNTPPAATPSPQPKGASKPVLTTVQRLSTAYNQTANQRSNSAPLTGSTGTTERLVGVYQPGYDANGNPAVQKWQNQSDDTKAARFLAKTHNDIQMQGYDPAKGSYAEAVGPNGTVYNDGYGFYQGDYQNFSLALGLNDQPTVVRDATFNQLVKQNNLQVVYRGDTGDSQIDRFMTSTYSHTGVGSYGDGFYFSDNKSTANSYAASKASMATGNRSDGRILKMALSPNARIISYSDLQLAMRNAGAPLTRALSKQGSSASSASYWNSGEAQFALKMGYNVIAGCGFSGSDYHYALTRDAFIVSSKAIHAR